ncbi:hypothetical protein GCM10011611_15180 [Aliidongia dinghuensis]|uniref:Uncharacterized protein n=1 Tax=Aliidongia dinghuensis TaxID=1867774 RepID=A0A8J2YRM8_9PROT|nr:hypothetical protein [Aliidongia dinghuensis]GGF10539.1 hypothetical protein GCM10011611_15180 [Aliidongia dinghuensis]
MESFDHAGTEPRLAELLLDPITQLVMRRDHITEHEVHAAIAIARRALLHGDHATPVMIRSVNDLS